MEGKATTMKSRSILLKIVFFAEMIIAARILVFTLPVIINAYGRGASSLAGIEGLTVITMTLIASFYFMTGLASLLGMRGWKLFHYLGSALTLVLTYSLAQKAVEFNAGMSAVFYIPVAVSLALSLFVGLDKRSARHAG
jgi:hypothetical protein